MRTCMFRITLALLVSFAQAAGQQSPPNRINEPIASATVVSEPPVIDGNLSESSWQNAQLLSGFVQREPMEGEPVSERTEVRILYDGEALYVGAWLFDRDPSGIVVGRTLRDASLNDTDAFLIVLDTYLDRQNAFVFGTTPAGIEYDGQVANEQRAGGGGGGSSRQQRGSGGGFNLNWDGSWEVATSIDGSGWYAEMRIPFSTLRYPRGGVQAWGLNFARNIRRQNEQSVWAPIPRQFNPYRVSLAGTLSRIQAPARRILTITPYTLADGFKDYTAPFPDADFSATLGADAKIGLNQSLTLDLTVNTDFAQVEVDDQQVNLTRFPLFFPEKRAFFLENAGTFSVGSGRSAELFFSRRIGLSGGTEVPIRAGARLSGKVAGMQVGFLNIQTQGVDQINGSNFGVIRASQEFENRTTLGAILVSRLNTENTGDYNLTYGIDGNLGIGQDLTFNGWAAGTDTRGVAGGEYGFSGGGNYTTRDWQVTGRYRQIGAEFNPEVGFVNRRAYRYLNTRVLRHIRLDNVSWFRELRPHVQWEEYWDLGGFSESRKIHIDNHFEFANGAFFQLPGINIIGEGLQSPFRIREGIVIPAGSYNNIDWEFRFNSNRSAPLSMSGGWGFGGFYSGTRFSPNATVSYRFRDVFSASIRLNYFDVRLDEGSFTTSVLGLNASYSFTPRIYVQGQLQYNADTEDLGSNIRLAWLNTAGTGLYIVYNDIEHFGVLERTGFSRGPQQRQFVIKYTKLLDLSSF